MFCLYYLDNQLFVLNGKNLYTFSREIYNKHIPDIWFKPILFVYHQLHTWTSKFHGEFMSPALFLFEVLKMVKLTRGPLALYQLPKYWSRKPVIKNNFKILKKPHAYLQATCKVSKDRLKTVVGVTGSRYLLPICFCSIRTKKMSKLKKQKKW